MSVTCEITRRDADMVLNALPGIGPVVYSKLMAFFEKEPSAVLEASKKSLMQVDGIGAELSQTIHGWKDIFDLEAEHTRMEKLGVRFILRGEEEYPSLLEEIYDPPIGLYVRGEPLEPMPAVAMVGSRRASFYGKAIARKLALELVRSGVMVVSGMARGIDGAAHEGALEAGGPTLGVLGCGVDVVYPREHASLYSEVIKKGALVSEFRMGRIADKQTFPRRNRIVAGMCAGTIVVESDKNGGSMITARLAGEQGRHIFAIPGRIDQITSRGCHQLIRDGATLVTSVDEVLEELEFSGILTLSDRVEAPSKGSAPKLSGDEKKVWEMLKSGESLEVDTLCARCELSVPAVMAALLSLELKKVVGKSAGGFYERR